jgi:hypothetical protein
LFLFCYICGTTLFLTRRSARQDGTYMHTQVTPYFLVSILFYYFIFIVSSLKWDLDGGSLSRDRTYILGLSQS